MSDKTNPSYISAPLIHLVDTDPAKLNPEQLRAHHDEIRKMRGTPATVKARSNTRTNGSTSTAGKLNLNDLL